MPTLTDYPTLTPAPPALQSSSYELNPWSAEKANYMVQLMQGYPNTLPQSARGEYNQTYYQSFMYPILAQREALLRYPDAPQANQWRWGLAYNLALINNPESGAQYAALIADYLNQGEIELDYLYAWFPMLEPSMTLYMTEIKPPSGFLSSYILELHGSGGSAFIWLLESTSGYEAYSVISHFDFENSTQANWIVSDLDRNPQNGNELAVYFSNLPGQYQLNPPYVFLLNKFPPVQLSFFPASDIFNIGMDFANYWSVLQDHSGKNDLVFKSTIYPPCPVTVRHDYRWNGLYFKNVKNQLDFQDKPLSIGYCETIVDHAAKTWGPAAAILLMEELLPEWFPSQDQEGNPYPLDAKDEWRYRLGIYNALVGDSETAIRYFGQVSTDPVVPNSRWIIPSQEFLAAYQKPQDIYQACVAAELCDPFYAIEALVGSLLPDVNALESLWQSGVKTNSSGWFDFDGDGESERWFTVRHRPRQTLEFWILAKYLGGTKALRVSHTNTIQPTLDYLEEPYIADEGLGLQPVVILDGEMAFSMQRLPDDQEPYLVDVPLRKEYPSRFFVPLESYEKVLLGGASSEVIQEKLLGLKDNPGLLCKTTWSCDKYYYLLGLASELAGDEPGAIEAYHRLWSDYSKSPYTTMARLKLNVLVEVLYPTTTGTPTPTYTVIPVTVTPTMTGTIIVSTATPTPSPTFTATGTPPTAIPTSTATFTPTATEPYPPPVTTQPYPTP